MNAVLSIAYRDFTKLMRDKPRFIASLVFPIIFVLILGGSLDANLRDDVGFNFLIFTFTGVYAQTLFQSTAAGIISLIEDRENDFSQEIFVAPVSRYAIVFGKILGESMVAFVQGLGVLVFGLLVGVEYTLPIMFGLLWTGLICCLLGGGFGVIVLSNLGSQRTANQIFPFLLFPQYFLGGVFSPIEVLPWYLDILSKITPMRYAVDLVRSVFYIDSADASQVVLESTAYNLGIIGVMFVAFMLVGTVLFVRSEQNR